MIPSIPRLIASPYIVNGVIVPQNKYPFMAALFLGQHKHFCGGALVSPHYVVTAAHCVAGLSPSQAQQLHVKLGLHDVYSQHDFGVEVRRVSTIYTHSGFKSSPHFWNDIAVLKRDRDVPYT